MDIIAKIPAANTASNGIRFSSRFALAHLLEKYKAIIKITPELAAVLQPGGEQMRRCRLERHAGFRPALLPYRQKAEPQRRGPGRLEGQRGYGQSRGPGDPRPGYLPGKFRDPQRHEGRLILENQRQDAKIDIIGA